MFDQGNVTFRVCRLPMPLPQDAVERFAEHAATSLDSVMEEPQWGWVTARHLLDTNITEESIRYAGHYHLCLRQAERKIPNSLLTAECRLQELVKLKADGKERLNKNDRRTIKDEVKQRLLPAMPPQLSGTYFVIDNSEQLMFISATSQKALDCFDAMFNTTFGCTAMPMTPENAATEIFHIDPITIPSFCISPSMNTPEGEGNGTIGQNFLTWLWFYQELKNGVLPQSKLGEFSLMLDGPLTFVSENAGAFESVVRKGTPTISAEAKAALMVGKKLKSAKLTLAREDQQWTCQLDADQFIFRGLKLPEGEAMDPISVFEERMTNLHIFHDVFFGLYQKFLKEMSDSARATEYQTRAKEWVAHREER